MHALVTRNHVRNRVVADMAHVKLAAGIGEHCETVKLLPRSVRLYGKAARIGPLSLKRQLQSLRCIFLAHRSSVSIVLRCLAGVVVPQQVCSNR